ncbi:MAG: acyl-CoA dehydrogenase family protein [Armatimonadetes bacterium]|nr:acyl-CoA dehydrogenase family protein [Armatimonadota bacterium]MDE2205516.1 acyl-CoA dehydrogenase family protein [Armatimonadota bacterium]
MAESPVPAGGAFLIDAAGPNSILIPEQLSAETRQMARTMADYVRREVMPRLDEIEHQQEGLMRRLVQGAGDLGLLAIGVPECYGGLGLNKSAVTLITEKAAPNASFAISVGAHIGIGTLPLLFFGTPAQKQKYLPTMASGERLSAFALSEANSGSDALAAKTTATLDEPRGCYLLNGTKMWTTNAGFADLLTVFAKVDGEKMTAFLVETSAPGVSLGREELKLGLKGSSTRRVVLENAEVPVENVLGEIGKGHRAALYPLNLGRYAIGAGALGASKEALAAAAKYALQRSQFGQAIANFGLIQAKLGEMATRIFAAESMVYRVAGYWDDIFGRIDHASPAALEGYRAAAEEYSIECAIIKFYGSEMLDYVVDEALQIHGGYGYTEEFPMARAYRDARINRIFEGTNEINRLTVLDQALRRAKAGRLDLESAAHRLRDTVLAPPETLESTDPLGAARALVGEMRNVLLYVAGQAWEALGEGLAEQQEVAAAIADMAADLLALESSAIRVSMLQESAPGDRAECALAALQTLASDAADRAAHLARTVLVACAQGDALATHYAVVRRLLRPSTANTVALRRKVAALVLQSEGFPWGA